MSLLVIFLLAVAFIVRGLVQFHDAETGRFYYADQRTAKDAQARINSVFGLGVLIGAVAALVAGAQ